MLRIVLVASLAALALATYAPMPYAGFAGVAPFYGGGCRTGCGPWGAGFLPYPGFYGAGFGAGCRTGCGTGCITPCATGCAAPCGLMGLSATLGCDDTEEPEEDGCGGCKLPGKCAAPESGRINLPRNLNRNYNAQQAQSCLINKARRVNGGQDIDQNVDQYIDSRDTGRATLQRGIVAGKNCAKRVNGGQDIDQELIQEADFDKSKVGLQLGSTQGLNRACRVNGGQKGTQTISQSAWFS